uniref:Dynein heavy chain ATP-binding dynein motor region domain-containing protein n=1 Tax=Monopterus albus TaxID=43700 RepID=A0A3Q3KPF6_MONAL
EETFDPVIDPLLGRHTIKKGSCIKVGDKECYFHPGFRLILHTKLANPHYKPEIQAQTTLINFTVTRDGLEDQGDKNLRWAPLVFTASCIYSLCCP